MQCLYVLLNEILKNKTDSVVRKGIEPIFQAYETCVITIRPSHHHYYKYREQKKSVKNHNLGLEPRTINLKD